ncbi:PREDICTED: uncharacterized protein LOC105144091 isoform X2 [Acromyrmex echinatior]|uniref:uncharacterized protein LOC105144091 isoform X2 n=1 Tax=Acromyrmex echinatior TaxID=103372 RepID=UPI0005810DA2|nr:PREDICTED: uncharacterized protein LOC105144091 isoform X2 [Acromyrmex echinatior]
MYESRAHGLVSHSHYRYAKTLPVLRTKISERWKDKQATNRTFARFHGRALAHVCASHFMYLIKCIMYTSGKVNHQIESVVTDRDNEPETERHPREFPDISFRISNDLEEGEASGSSAPTHPPSGTFENESTPASQRSLDDVNPR